MLNICCIKYGTYTEKVEKCRYLRLKIKFMEAIIKIVNFDDGFFILF
jgi:hypothetical protein